MTEAPAHRMLQPLSCVSGKAGCWDQFYPEVQQVPAPALLAGKQWPGLSLQMSTALAPVMSAM